MKTWEATPNPETGKYLGTLEIQSPDDGPLDFELIDMEDRILFGSACNTGFLESGYILKEGRSMDETLRELEADLEVYYRDGKEYVSDIVCNERM